MRYLLLVLFIIACSSQQPQDEKIEKFATAYTAYLKSLATDSADVSDREAVLNSVLQETEFDSSGFSATLTAIRQDPAKMAQFIDLVTEKLSSPPKD